MFVVAKAAVGKRALVDDPIRGAARLGERRRIATGRVQFAKRRDHPSILAGIDMRINAWNSLAPPCLIAQLEVVGAVFSFDEIGVLADIGSATRSREEVSHVSMNALGWAKI